MSKRRSYDVSFKLLAVECAEKTSKEAAARQMGVDARRIQEWCQQKAVLSSMKKGKSSRKRLHGAGRKALYPDLEDALLSWIVDMRSRNLRVSRSMIQWQAKALSSSSDFRASTG